MMKMTEATKKAIETVAEILIKNRKENFVNIEEKMGAEKFLVKCFYEHLQNEYDYEEFDYTEAIEGEFVDSDIEYNDEMIEEILSLFDKYEVNYF